MNVRKFNDIKISENRKMKKVKLSKEEKIKLKEKKKGEKIELKKLREEDKKVLKSTKELLGFIDVLEDDTIKMKNGYIDIYQIDSKDIYSFSEEEAKLHVYNYISFLRGYPYDFKLISMNFPVNTGKQQEFLREKLKGCKNETYSKFLSEELKRLIYLEENRQNKEFYIMIFVNETEDREVIKRTLFRSQSVAVKFMPLEIEKKLKILFKINNPNTKLI